MRCPTCNRLIVGSEPACPRCGTDLLRLSQLQRTAERFNAKGSSLLGRGDARRAREAFAAAARVEASERTKRGVAVSLLAEGRYADALCQAASLLPPLPGAARQRD